MSSRADVRAGRSGTMTTTKSPTVPKEKPFSFSTCLLYALSISSLTMSAYAVSKINSTECPAHPPSISGNFSTSNRNISYVDSPAIQTITTLDVRVYTPTENRMFVKMGRTNTRNGITDKTCVWRVLACEWSLWCTDADDVGLATLIPSSVENGRVVSYEQTYIEIGPTTISSHQRAHVSRSVWRL